MTTWNYTTHDSASFPGHSLSRVFRSLSRRAILVIVLWQAIWALCVALIPSSLALLTVSGTYVVTPTVSGSPWDVASSKSTWTALANSTYVAAIAAIVGIAWTGVVRRYARLKWPLVVLVACYAIDPVFRGVSLRLAVVYSVDWCGAWGLDSHWLQDYLVPGLVLGFQYLPVFLFLWVDKPERRERWPTVVAFVFVRLPQHLRMVPVQASLFFLLALFDYWAVQLVSGNRLNYWGPLLIQRGLNSRDLSAAATMVVMGLLIVLAVFGATSCFCAAGRAFIRRLRPHAICRIRFAGFIGPMISIVAVLTLACIGVWPVMHLLYRVISAAAIERLALPDGAADAIISSFLLCGSVAFVAATLGMVLALTTKWPGWIARSVPSSALVLALAPEQCFLLVGVLIWSAIPFRSDGFLLWIVLMAMFAPLAAFVANRILNHEHDPRVALLSRCASINVARVSVLALREYRTHWYSLCGFLLWLALDEILLCDYLSEPGQKPFAAWVFGTAMRGLSYPEQTACGLFSVARLLVGCVFLAAVRTRTKGEV